MIEDEIIVPDEEDEGVGVPEDDYDEEAEEELDQMSESSDE